MSPPKSSSISKAKILFAGGDATQTLKKCQESKEVSESKKGGTYDEEVIYCRFGNGVCFVSWRHSRCPTGTICFQDAKHLDSWGCHHQNPTKFVEIVEKASGGRIKITLMATRAVVPAFEFLDAVNKVILDMGHSWPGYWFGKHPAATLFGSVAGGMASEVYKTLGMTVVILPGGEIVPALQRGVIDAGEFSEPSSDMAMGFQDMAKYYYLPGMHQPTGMMEVLINKSKWDPLPADLKAIIEYAAMATQTWWDGAIKL